MCAYIYISAHICAYKYNIGMNMYTYVYMYIHIRQDKDIYIIISDTYIRIYIYVWIQCVRMSRRKDMCCESVLTQFDVLTQKKI